MEFFDRKEEVIDIELTQYGKHLLSLGKFKPNQYAFFDDDILYDIKYVVSGSEGSFDSTDKSALEERQNLTESRIKEVPRLKIQYNFSDRERRTGKSQTDYQSDCGPVLSTEAYVLDLVDEMKIQSEEIVTELNLDLEAPGTEEEEAFEEQQLTSLNKMLESDSLKGWLSELNDLINLSNKTNNFGLYSAAASAYDCLYQKSLSDIKYFPYSPPLGNSSLSKKYTPAWSIKFLNGELLNDTSKWNGTTLYYSGSNFSTMKIPQLETRIQHETYIAKFGQDDTLVRDYSVDNILFSDGELDTVKFVDNTIFQVKTDYLLFDINELNTDFIKDNFEVEVFKVQEKVDKEAAFAFVHVKSYTKNYTPQDV